MEITSNVLLLLLAIAGFREASSLQGQGLPVPVGTLPPILKKSEEDDVRQGNIKIDQAMRNVTKRAGQRVRLLCDISGDPAPTYTWLKNGRTLTSDERITIKIELFGSSLRLDQLHPSDSGFYTCIGRNVYGSRNVTGYLTVRMSRGKNRNRKNKNREGGAGDRGDVQNPDTGPGATGSYKRGFCQAFKSTACKGYIQNNPVFVEHHLKQAINDPAFLIFLADLKTKRISDSCLTPLIKASCFYSFPLCHRYDGVEVPKRLCKKSCEALLQHPTCVNVFNKLRNELQTDSLRLIPDCSQLPDSTSAPGRQCIYLDVSRIPTIVNKEWEPLPNVPEKPAETRVHSCYNGTGGEYRGEVSRTMNSRPCIPWRRMAGYRSTFAGDHAFCRNPLVKEMSAPWCFVTAEGDRELCAVPKCDEKFCGILEPNQYIFDVLSTQEEPAQFTFCRYTWFAPFEVSESITQEYLEITYLQIKQEYLSGKWIAPLRGALVSSEIEEIALLSALQLYIPGMKLPHSIKDLRTTVPQDTEHFLRSTPPPALLKIVENRFIHLQEHPHQAMARFLLILSKWRYFGAVSYKIRVLNIHGPLATRAFEAIQAAKDILVSANRNGVSLRDETTRVDFASYPLTAVESVSIPPGRPDVLKIACRDLEGLVTFEIHGEMMQNLLDVLKTYTDLAQK